MFLKVDYFMFSVSPAKYSPLLVKAQKEVPVMLVTKGIDIYTVDSRFLYCGFSIQAGKKHYRCFFFLSSNIQLGPN